MAQAQVLGQFRKREVIQRFAVNGLQDSKTTKEDED